MSKRITHFHILVGGFHQRYGDATNGLAGIEYELMRAHGTGNGLTDFSYVPWHVNPVDFARRCVKFGQFATHPSSRIQIAGYSYGGQTAVNMCLELQELGVPVNQLTLIDPVKRRSRMPWGWLAALNRYATLEVPRNVENLVWFYQRQDWPRSHKVIVHEETQSRKAELMIPHTAIDNNVLVRRAIMEQAEIIHT